MTALDTLATYYVQKARKEKNKDTKKELFAQVCVSVFICVLVQMYLALLVLSESSRAHTCSTYTLCALYFMPIHNAVLHVYYINAHVHTGNLSLHNGR